MSVVLEEEARKDDTFRLLLGQWGIPPVDAERYPNAFAEIRRISQRLRQTDCRVIGFVPADNQVGTIALVVQLALAINQLRGPNCIVIDVNTVRPQFANAPQIANTPMDSFGFRTFSVAERVSLSTPAIASGTLLTKNAEQLLECARQNFDYVFLDLTGFAPWGTHCAAYDLVDGVVVVALSDRTKENDILLCSDDIPPKQRLGVVLVG